MKPSEVTNALHNTGFSNTAGDSAMVSRGQEICQYIDEGYSEAAVQRYIFVHTGTSIGWADAGQMVAIAQDYLC